MTPMIKYLFATTLLLAACSSRDEAFCNCLETGDKFNESSKAFLEKGEGDQNELLELKKEKEKACANYTEMSGEEMLKRKKDCGFEE